MTHEHKSRDERFDQNIFHDIDHEKCRKRLLEGFYGKIAYRQNQFIASAIKGKRVLDAGAGYGGMTRDLKAMGFDVTGGDLNEEKIAKAREWFGLELDKLDIYNTGYPDNHFDAVILRDVVFHLDFEKALNELCRIAKRQILIFQGNDVILRKIGQTLYGHKEFNERDPQFYCRACAARGWNVEPLRYIDTVAFPLSGGYIGHQWVPNWDWLTGGIMTVDQLLTGGLAATGLDKHFCFRFLLSATRPDAS